MQYNSKQRINAPCIYSGKNCKTGKREDAYPTVNCALTCNRCVWNPVEKRRRMKQGHFEKRTIMHELHDDAGREVISRITKECYVLVFPEREEIKVC